MESQNIEYKESWRDEYLTLTARQDWNAPFIGRCYGESFKAKEMPKTVSVADGDDVEKWLEKTTQKLPRNHPETIQKTTQKKLPRK